MMPGEIIKQIMNVWATDGSIQEFCMDAYGIKPLIKGFSNPDDPPPESDFPLIEFYGFRNGGGMSEPVLKAEMLVGFAVSDDGIEENADLRTISSIGFERAHTLRSLAEIALYKARIGKITWKGEADPLMTFPVFTATSAITLETQNIKPRI
jgi:hypothetical protein